MTRFTRRDLSWSSLHLVHRVLPMLPLLMRACVLASLLFSFLLAGGFAFATGHFAPSALQYPHTTGSSLHPHVCDMLHGPHSSACLLLLLLLIAPHAIIALLMYAVCQLQASQVMSILGVCVSLA